MKRKYNYGTDTDCTHISVMPLTDDKETWFNVTVHSLHEDSLFVESEQMLVGQWERKMCSWNGFQRDLL